MVIYSLRDAADCPRYIGVSGNPKLRKQAHALRLPHLTMVILMQGLTKREASELEIALISKLNKNGPQLLNIRA